MPVAEVFLSAFIWVLFDKLASGDLLKLARQEGIHTVMTNWAGMLLKIQAMLSVAKDKQIRDKAVQLWLEDLQDLAYDLDEVPYEFSTQALRHKLTTPASCSDAQPINSNKVRAFLSGCFTAGLNPSAVVFHSRMRSKIEDISTRLHSSFKQKSKLDLVKVTEEATTWHRPASTSLIHEPCICGRDEDRRKIVELLLRDDFDASKFGVIPIAGMPGVGKTTLLENKRVHNS